jgi:hypothetical protein
MLLYINVNMNQIYSRIPCFIKKNPKQQLKSIVYQNKICGFPLQIPIALHYSFQNSYV